MEYMRPYYNFLNKVQYFIVKYTGNQFYTIHQLYTRILILKIIILVTLSRDVSADQVIMYT